MANKTVRDIVKQLNKECIEFLPNKDSDIIKILEFVLELNEAGVISSMDTLLTDKQEIKLSEILERIKDDEPLEYITNTGYFYGNRFKVTKDTLIPRSETEILVDLALSEISQRVYDPEFSGDNIDILDVGTGSGCIPISIALAQKGNIKITAVDISPEALKIAEENITGANLEKIIGTHLSDLFENISGSKKFDIILANLPYVSSQKINTLPKSVKNFEPEIALDGGKNGTEIIFKLIEQSKDRLKKNGVIILEADPDQTEPTQNFATKVLKNSKVTTFEDLSGDKRFVVIKT